MKLALAVMQDLIDGYRLSRLFAFGQMMLQALPILTGKEVFGTLPLPGVRRPVKRLEQGGTGRDRGRAPRKGAAP